MGRLTYFRMGKPRGLRTARKHVKNRRAQVWADLDYKKANLGTRWKANPFGGASHAKGIVLEKVCMQIIYKCIEYVRIWYRILPRYLTPNKALPETVFPHVNSLIPLPILLDD